MFDSFGHLSDEGIAVCVDAIRAKSFNALPDLLLSHVDGCDRCKREIVGTLALLDEETYENQTLQTTITKTGQAQRSSFLFAYRVAASIVVCVSIGILFYLAQILRSDGPALLESKRSVEVQREQARPESSPDRAQLEQSAEILENFTASPTLENLANAVPRSTSVVVRSPRNGATFNGKIAFEWTATEPGGITLEILSNTGKPLHKFVHHKSPLLFPMELKPGLYYWKLEGQSELLYVGKFLVK